MSGSYKDKKVAFEKAPQNFLIVGVKFEPRNARDSLLRARHNRFYCTGATKTALCYSAHRVFDSKMATLGISKSQILRMYEQNRYVLFGCAKQHDLRGIYFEKPIKKFWGYRGIFQNPPKSFLNYLLLDKSQFNGFIAPFEDYKPYL